MGGLRIHHHKTQPQIEVQGPIGRATLESQGYFLGRRFCLQPINQALTMTLPPKFGEQTQVRQMQCITAANNHSSNGLRDTWQWFCHHDEIADLLVGVPMMLLMCSELHAHHLGKQFFIPMTGLQLFLFYCRKKIEAKISILWQRGAQ
jgi:hypothetical protein